MGTAKQAESKIINLLTNPFTTFDVLGIPIAAVQIPELIDFVEKSILSKEQGFYVAFAGMQGVVEAQKNEKLKNALTEAISVCDGKPLVLLGRRKGHLLPRRVYGPEFVSTFCEKTKSKYRHFFYGGNSGVADLLAKTLSQKYGIQVAGTYCPPFHALSSDEEVEVINLINNSNADLVWVGIGAPKQEIWMYEMRNKLNVTCLFGVGAAYDFLTGIKTQAPRWIGDMGFEWLYRLITEPRRLWKRYIFGGAKFAYLLIKEKCTKNNKTT